MGKFLVDQTLVQATRERSYTEVLLVHTTTADLCSIFCFCLGLRQTMLSYLQMLTCSLTEYLII